MKTLITIWQFVIYLIGIFVALYLKTGDGHTDRVECMLFVIFVTLFTILLGEFKDAETKSNSSSVK